MAVSKTSLSAGSIIRSMLMADTEVTSRTNKIFPITVDKAEMPYIVYRRVGFEQNPTKSGYPGADTVQIEVLCVTEKYAEGVELAEAVRQCLDGQQGYDGELNARSIHLADSEEDWQNDAFIQQLVFNVKI